MGSQLKIKCHTVFIKFTEVLPYTEKNNPHRMNYDSVNPFLLPPFFSCKM